MEHSWFYTNEVYANFDSHKICKLSFCCSCYASYAVWCELCESCGMILCKSKLYCGMCDYILCKSKSCTIYANWVCLLMQCDPILSPINCKNCIRIAMQILCNLGKLGLLIGFVLDSHRCIWKSMQLLQFKIAKIA